MEKNNKKINIVFTFFIILICICMLRITFQNDTFFSIAVGRQIEDTGVDMVEHLTWHDNLSYTYSHWLYDILNYNLYKLFGFKGIYFFTLLITILIGITIYNILKKICKNSIVVPFALSVYTIFLAGDFFTSRAQIISYLLFILEVYFIEKILESGRKIYGIGLIIIPIIIANVHAAMWPLYFVLYMPYIAEAFLNRFTTKNWNNKRIKYYESLIKKENDEEKKENYFKEIEYLKEEIENVEKVDKKIVCKGFKNIKLLIIIGIIAIFTGFCTPIGSTPFTYMFKTMNDGLSSKYIQELRPASIPESISFFIFVIIFVLMIISPKVKIKLSDMCMLLGFIVLSFYGVRNLSFLFLIGIIPYTRTLISYFKDGDLEKLDNECIKFFSSKKATIIITLYIIFILSYVYIAKNVGRKFVDESKYPVGACEYILENIDLDKARIYNGFDYGSYMEYKGIPVYMDSRSEMYTKAYNDTTVYQDFIDLSKGELLYDDMVKKYNLTHLLIDKDEWIHNYIEKDNNYKIIYEDEYFILFEVLNVSME